MGSVKFVKHTYAKADIDTRWLVDQFVEQVHAATVRLPERVLRISMSAWGALQVVQQEEVRRVAAEVGVRIEIVP